MDEKTQRTQTYLDPVGLDSWSWKRPKVKGYYSPVLQQSEQTSGQVTLTGWGQSDGDRTETSEQESWGLGTSRVSGSLGKPGEDRAHRLGKAGSWSPSDRRWHLNVPVTLACCLLSTAMICLLKYVRGGRLFIFGGFLILLGGLTVLVEFFERLSFGTPMFRWSLYSLSVFGVAGAFLLIAGMIPSMRQELERRFFF